MDTRKQLSDACFTELKTCGQLKRYTSHQTKMTGDDAGVILHGTSKTGKPKTTYAKRMLDQNSLQEYLAISLARDFGVVAPKLKIVRTQHERYFLFSRSIVERQPFELSEGSTFYTLNEIMKNTRLCQMIRSENGIIIDKSSIIKLMLSVMIFNMVDIHDENVGLIIDHARGLARLAIVDCKIADYPGSLEMAEKQKSIALAIKHVFLNRRGFDIIDYDELKPEDYAQTLHDMNCNINENLLAAAKAHTNLPHCAQNLFHAIDRCIESWQANRVRLQAIDVHENYVLRYGVVI